ncbi:MAG: iron-containing alcohol dehydrogenase [Phascolarctobacterium faecium]
MPKSVCLIVCGALQEAGLHYVTLGGVVPNPRLSKVYEGIEICRREKVDFILAVGGGSVIDSAKAIGYGITNPGDVWDYYSGKAPQACAPIGAVLTIAAAGSEMSNASVITNEDGWLKRGHGRPMPTVNLPFKSRADLHSAATKQPAAVLTSSSIL